MSACCGVNGHPKARTFLRGMREMFVWFLPSALLVLIPKCPACLAAYVMIWSGIGLSLSTATWLRWGLVFVSITLLLFLIVNRLCRIGLHLGFRKER